MCPDVFAAPRTAGHRRLHRGPSWLGGEPRSWARLQGAKPGTQGGWRGGGRCVGVWAQRRRWRLPELSGAADLTNSGRGKPRPPALPQPLRRGD